ncbi:MAG: hypothetical protein HQK53_05090 [Oligoflexia bacterium]|nr:hypothetical protein [Oligoflexia bacterium]
MSIMVSMHGILMLVATFVIIWSVIIVRKKNRPDWLKLHSQLVTLGICIVIISCCIIFYVKQQNSYPHLASIHAIVGIIAVTFLLINYAVGVFVVTKVMARKLIHHLSGKITTAIIIITAFTGIFRFLQILN